VMSGTGLLHHGQQQVPVGPGDAVCYLAGDPEAHASENTGAVPLVIWAFGNRFRHEVFESVRCYGHHCRSRVYGYRAHGYRSRWHTEDPPTSATTRSGSFSDGVAEGHGQNDASLDVSNVEDPPIARLALQD